VERIVKGAPEPADWCAEELNANEEYFVPVHTLWQEYCGLRKRHEATGVRPEGFQVSSLKSQASPSLSYDAFEELLRSDERFYISPGRGPGAGKQEVLDRMSFPSRALVGLAARKPAGNELDSAIKAKAAQLMHALRKAWDARPADSPEVERRLIFLMEQAQKLCEKVGVQQEEKE
jgi:hypothetical protein